MLKDEFNRLMALFHEAAEGKRQNLEEVFSEALEFLTHLQNLMATGSEEERAKAIEMMSMMYEQMMLESKHITENSGLTEEQLVAFSEDPANFTPEQWKEIQDAKEKITHAGHEIIKTISHIKEEGGNLPSAEKKPHHKNISGKKSTWTRS